MLQMTSTVMKPPPTTVRCRRTPHCRPARPRVGPRRRRRRCGRLASMGGGVAAQRRQRRPTHGADLHNPRRQDRRYPVLMMRQEGHRILRRRSARPLQPWRLTPSRPYGRWRPALGADLPSHPRQPGLRPGRQRRARSDPARGPFIREYRTNCILLPHEHTFYQVCDTNQILQTYAYGPSVEKTTSQAAAGCGPTFGWPLIAARVGATSGPACGVAPDRRPSLVIGQSRPPAPAFARGCAATGSCLCQAAAPGAGGPRPPGLRRCILPRIVSRTPSRVSWRH